jgi:hypothetical protein
MKTLVKWIGLVTCAVFAIALVGVHDAQAATHQAPHVMILGATLGANVHTLADLAKRKDPDGKIAAIIELLGINDEILEDMLWKEGNLPTGERTTIRTGLPTVAWRLLNQGVQPSKSTTAQVDVQTGKLEAWCEIDQELVDLNGNTNEYRMSEATAFLQAMNQEFASTLFYGNASTAQEEFTGLAPQYSDSTADNGQNIIKCGGSGSDNSSIWLIGWGATTVHGLYPKGSVGGIYHKDFGPQVVETTAGIGGSRMVAYRDQWKWDCGVVVRDWRYAVRMCNVDISNLIADSAGTSVKLIEYMGKAIHRIPTRGNVRLAFYANRTVQSMLTLQALNKSTSALSLQDAMSQFGHNISEMRFLGIPIRTCDSLLETEATVS